MNDETVRLARYNVGVDCYRAAKILIGKHGDGAKTEASRCMQEWLDKGDERGAAMWADILFAIGEIQRAPLPGEAWN